jgi:hypothetical protein
MAVNGHDDYLCHGVPTLDEGTGGIGHELGMPLMKGIG